MKRYGTTDREIKAFMTGKEIMWDYCDKAINHALGQQFYK